ncbi:MAG: hypothetical protein KGL39_57570, partial [Patescibacteria group bacterium]|nr:hypothetical protein [Patescibacteria group bacterium]
MSAGKYRVLGVYRPRQARPGFGIPIFSADGAKELLVQVSDDNGATSDFRPCSAERTSVRWLSGEHIEKELIGTGYYLRAQAEPCTEQIDNLPASSIGEALLHAFETDDGRILVGDRPTLSRLVRSEIGAVRAAPFVLHDLGEFIGDRVLVNEAIALCASLETSGRKEPHFAPLEPGVIVYHVHSPSRRGIITGRTRKMGPVKAWEVNYSANDRPFIPESALKRVELTGDSLEDRIAAGQFGRPDDLRRRMTFEKLKGSLSEFIYSMDAAEIDFLEYQFKPVLKFVESPNERLLLADEVGLGKTIEAALIWLEL